MKLFAVKYNCHHCGIERRELLVPARAPDQDLACWVEGTMIYVAADHMRTSPECPSKRCDLVIPTDGKAQRLGLEPVH